MGGKVPPTSSRPIFVNRANPLIFFPGVGEGADVDPLLGGYYRILRVSERFLSLILLGGEILRAAAEITCSQSWDYRLRSQKEQLLGKAECLANCSVCIGLL